MTQYYFKNSGQHFAHSNTWSINNNVNYDFTDPFGNSGQNKTSTVIRAYPSGFPRDLTNGDTFQIRINTSPGAIRSQLADGDHAPPSEWFDTFDLNGGENRDPPVLTFIFGGLKSGAPTYLEELAKLDQYSKAQYIPRYRR